MSSKEITLTIKTAFERTKMLLLKSGLRSLGRRKLKTVADGGIGKLQGFKRRTLEVQQAAEAKQELSRLRIELTQARTSKHLPGFSSESMPVFFIVGRARSGTTWLRSILNAHPEILCWGEGRLFERSFRRKDIEESKLKNIPPNSLYGAFFESRDLRAWMDSSIWSMGKDTDERLNDLTRLAIDYFLADQLSKTDKRIIGDKTPFVSAEVVEEISAIYPEAKVVHIIRDGRDVAVSTIHHMWNYAKCEGGIYDLEAEELEKRQAYRTGSLVPPVESLFTKERLARIASNWSTEVDRAVEAGTTLLGDNYTEVRYEELLERPVEEVQRLLKFLGADNAEEVAIDCVEKSGFERRSDRKRGQEDSASRSRKGVAGDWRNVFIEEDKRVFKEVAGGLLIELGYELDDSW
jgi:hypothetical protein